MKVRSGWAGQYSDHMRPATVLLLAALAWPVASALTAGYTLYNNPKLPFTAEIPSAWHTIKSTAGIPGLTIGTGGAQPEAVIQVQALPTRGEAVNLAEQFRGFEQGYAEQAAGRSRLQRLSSRPASYGGLKGIERVYNAPLGQAVLRYRVWLGADQNTFYNFSYITQAGSEAKHRATFEHVIASFRPR